jgi:hypothetical protein
MNWSLSQMRNLTVMIKNMIAPYQIGLNATKDHRSGMVSRILSLILYLSVARILLYFRKQLKALKRISG